MEEEDYRAPPYWLPYSNSFRRTDSPSSCSSSFSSGTGSNSFRRTGFVILLLAATVSFIPSLSSFSFRPQSVNNGWDYLNLLLLLFAILCGFLSRNSNGAGDSSSSYADSLKSNSSTPRSSSFDLMRSSSSDPDLRHESLVSHTDDQRRVFDDAPIYRSRRLTEEEERNRYVYSDFQTKIIHVDRVEVHSQEIRNESPLPLPPPPPPPPSQLYGFYCEQKIDNNEERGGSAVTKDFLTAFRKKKKKQRQKSVESFDIDSLFDGFDTQLPPPSPPLPPPPPPPPPPPSVFQNLFSSKKGRAKKLQRSQAPPPPPPSRVSKTRSAAFSQSHPNPPITTRKPVAPANSNSNHYAGRENRSPLISIPPLPPPPTPPPFVVPEWKFVLHGDYVRIESANESRRSWPDPIDDMEGIQSGGNSPSSSSTGASEATSLALFCPSPDVNNKADDFIASFWAAVQLEKVNSIRRRTETNLGPDPVLDPGPAF